VRHRRHASRQHLNVGGIVNRLLALGLVGLFGVSALAACGSDDKDSTVTAVKNANAAFCTDLTAYGTAVKDLAALDPATATKADYTAAADEVKSSREALVAAGKDVSEAEWANLEAQAETLNGQLKDAPDDATVSSIVADFNTQVATVRASVAALNTAVCPAGGTTTTTG
jgi:phosphoglycerate-specific signal transduction histidine kinase